MKKFLLSLLLVVGITAVQATEVKQEVVVLSDNTTFTGQMIGQATQFVERTVNLIATPFLSDKDVECLARNIFYESGSEPEEGKVAVGMVTLNRAQDPAYPRGVCGVVKQKTTLSYPKEVKTVKTVKTGWASKEVVETKTTMVQRVVCQFSWNCQKTIKIREDDPRWIESKRVAEELARGGYDEWQEKYSEAMNFHAIYVKPGWKLKRIAKVGNHIFYKGNQPVQQGG